MATRWTADQIPSQSGRVAVVTGANSGIGHEAALQLARVGANVVLACRNAEKGAAAKRKIEEAAPSSVVSVEALDLGSLASVRAFAERFVATHDRLDLLLNNAGVMAPPRQMTSDGFELQFGTNHLGHFALTGLLIDKMEGREGARVVIVSSGAHRTGRIAFDDLHGERSYGRWRAYGQSKLANLLFMYELDRRLRAKSSSIRTVAAHPGYAATNLQSAAAPRLDVMVMSVGNAIFAQSAAMGALPTLYAATTPDLAGGTYVGPSGMFEMRGHPQAVSASAAARDEAVAQRLWSVSAELTGVDPLRGDAAAATSAPSSAN